MFAIKLMQINIIVVIKFASQDTIMKWINMQQKFNLCKKVVFKIYLKTLKYSVH